ncbi:hypothetical protein SynROS8604_02747 [Synechococcus sp. ROS8604]|nr:hypothetical protein SynROS8604_02747 [Synechococcus sp. ROS8604]
MNCGSKYFWEDFEKIPDRITLSHARSAAEQKEKEGGARQLYSRILFL